MPSIAQSIKFALADDTATAALVGTRVYHDQAEQDSIQDGDYIVLTRIAGRPTPHLGNSTANINEVSYQVDCWSATPEGAQALGDAATAVLGRFIGNLGQSGSTVAVQATALETDRSDASPPTDARSVGPYRRLLDFHIWHEDP